MELWYASVFCIGTLQYDSQFFQSYKDTNLLQKALPFSPMREPILTSINMLLTSKVAKSDQKTIVSLLIRWLSLNHWYILLPLAAFRKWQCTRQQTFQIIDCNNNLILFYLNRIQLSAYIFERVHNHCCKNIFLTLSNLQPILYSLFKFFVVSFFISLK